MPRNLQTPPEPRFGGRSKTIKAMNYKVVDIEGVGEAYAAKLNEAGIESVADLLEACKTPAGRKNLETATGHRPDRLIQTY